MALGWIVGVIIYEYFSSLWQNEGLDWGFIVNFSIAGFIGIFIGLGLRNVFKKSKS